MNYYNLYREAVEAVRLGVLSIVFVPVAWVKQFRADVDTMRNRMVVPAETKNGITEFRVYLCM